MSKDTLTIAECRETLYRAGWTGTEFELIYAAGTLMENCEIDSTITLDDALACLDYPGLVAEFGARILYVRTGRDELGWDAGGSNGPPFCVDKADWLEFLCRNPIE